MAELAECVPKGWGAGDGNARPQEDYQGRNYDNWKFEVKLCGVLWSSLRAQYAGALFIRFGDGLKTRDDFPKFQYLPLTHTTQLMISKQLIIIIIMKQIFFLSVLNIYIPFR